MAIIKAFFRGVWSVITYPFIRHQAVYNLIIAAATALTLAWGVITFEVLKQKDKAEADLGKAQTELQEVHQRIKNSESTTVSLSNTYSYDKKTKSFILFPKVTIKNNGKDKLVLALRADTLTVSKIDFFDEGVVTTKKYYAPYFEKIATYEEEESKQFTLLTVPVDGERTIPYGLSVKSPGTYYVTFSASPYLEDGKVSINNHELIWFASEYVKIK
jgi:hypothetical protein